MIPPILFFFLKITLTIWNLLWFHINFRIICASSVKYVIGIWIGIMLNLEIALGSMDILMMLILPVCEHDISFHSFVSSSISFFNVLELCGLFSLKLVFFILEGIHVCISGNMYTNTYEAFITLFLLSLYFLPFKHSNI